MDGIIIPRMGRRTIRGLSLVAGIFAALYSQTARAQLPPCTEKKLPYPTLAQELRSENAGQPVTSVVVGDLRLEGDIHNRDAVRKRILEKLRGEEFESESNLVDHVGDFEIRGYLQTLGYFEAEVNAKAVPLDIKGGQQRFLVIADVTQGAQFRMGNLSFQNADPDSTLTLPRKELYDQFPLRPGAVLNVDQIRSGVEHLTKLYGSHGYIDFTAEPDFDVDHVNHRISVILKLWEGRQYHVQSVEVFGLDPKLQGKLRTTIRVHELFDERAIEDFFTKNKRVLPFHAEPANSLQVLRDVEKETVILRFVFEDCPQQVD
jgi:hypothetical protein